MLISIGFWNLAIVLLLLTCYVMCVILHCRYSLSVNVIGFVYSGVQICDLVKYLITKKHIVEHKLRGYFTFALDQVTKASPRKFALLTYVELNNKVVKGPVVMIMLVKNEKL